MKNFLDMTFGEAVELAESLPEVSSNGGGTRGYPLSIWYGDEDDVTFVVDYEDDGEPDRVQLVGQVECLYRE